MSLAQTHGSVASCPSRCEAQLHDFRRRVWTIKMAEAALHGGLRRRRRRSSCMFALDRVWDTPAGSRLALFAGRGGRPARPCRSPCTAGSGGTAGSNNSPGSWPGSTRRIGDQLLGIIELVQNDSEQAPVAALCEAAIQQVAEDARKRDFRDAVPRPPAPALGLAARRAGRGRRRPLRACPRPRPRTPGRGSLAPWATRPRYTFAAVEPLPGRLVVAHGEPFTVARRLADKTVWQPANGVGPARRPAAVAAAPRATAATTSSCPPQIDAGTARRPHRRLDRSASGSSRRSGPS